MKRRSLLPEGWRTGSAGRRARYGSNALILILAVLGILIVVNYLANANPKRWDLTEDKENTLAPETIEVLDSLSNPVTALAFFTQRASPESTQDQLELYAINSDGKFTYEFIDPELDPLTAQNYGITRDGTVVLVMGENKELLEFINEEEVTSGLIRLMNPGNQVIYFLTGHGEPSPDESGDRSYSILKGMLEDRNYTVKTLNLLAAGAVPEDATVMVVAGPIQPVTGAEMELLAGYIAQGGNLIMMEEPLPLTDFGEAPDPLADYLAQSWGIVLGEDIIVDLTSEQPFLAVGSEYADHPITQNMGGLFALLPTARSVMIQDAISTGVSQVELIKTSPQSWAETDLDAVSTGNLTPDEGVDILGPVPFAAAAENFESGSRIVVFGDAEFATDGFITAYGNSDAILNSVDWIAGQDELVNLTPKQSTQRVLLPPKENTFELILLFSVVIIPGLVIVAGLGVWFSRRKRG
jgi:ABC-type uncharacterized transport system involved in gliding motility auxiliary subunit